MFGDAVFEFSVVSTPLSLTPILGQRKSRPVATPAGRVTLSGNSRLP